MTERCADSVSGSAARLLQESLSVALLKGLDCMSSQEYNGKLYFEILIIMILSTI
jgi:hypothetical protein